MLRQIASRAVRARGVAARLIPSAAAAATTESVAIRALTTSAMVRFGLAVPDLIGACIGGLGPDTNAPT